MHHWSRSGPCWKKNAKQMPVGLWKMYKTCKATLQRNWKQYYGNSETVRALVLPEVSFGICVSAMHLKTPVKSQVEVALSHVVCEGDRPGSLLKESKALLTSKECSFISLWFTWDLKMNASNWGIQLIVNSKTFFSEARSSRLSPWGNT